MVVFSFNFINIYSQEKYMLIENKIDTSYFYQLNEIRIYDKRLFKNKYEKRRYDKLVRRVKKVYPFAKKAGDKLEEYNNVLINLKTENQKREFLKRAEKEIKKEYEGELKKLTFSEGLILIKLIDRETGRTSYQLVKELRGTFSAWFWQSLAKIFGLNLKLNYDPYGEDAEIESIIMQIEDGIL
ncbi:MAG: hypothetical protein A2X12_08305 [Bacteroidetes bacterium GWE2_29_8]|nr:MAG: hypothetical protein A2X12_08305 [Bacteroidetes bacterium GWE2_29_8]OFY19155.1 MAG: hypothetical protein A2X02_00415 [Bacteroidetes bacterium GWF2_29_10]